MSYFVSKYPEGAFCWTDVISTDIDKTENFLTTLFGWQINEMPANGGSRYKMFQLKGKNVAGGMQRTKEMGDIPSHWNSFVNVMDVNTTARKAQELGATVITQPQDSGSYGRMAGIIDPTGAPLMLWQAKESIGAEVVNDVDALVWNELHTNDTKTASQFYEQLFGWELAHNKDMNYTEIYNQGRRNGGIVEMPDMPSNWAVYFHVKDLNESLAKVKKHGGNVVGDKISIPVGTFNLIQEPAGAYFLIMEFNNEAEHWEE